MVDVPRPGPRGDFAAGRYVCPRCGARFLTVGDKRRHLKPRDCEEKDI